MSAPEHDFTCPNCLCCARCSRSMAQLQTMYVPCEGGVRHLHPDFSRDPVNPEVPYVPEWAIPLSRQRVL